MQSSIRRKSLAVVRLRRSPTAMSSRWRRARALLRLPNQGHPGRYQAADRRTQRRRLCTRAVNAERKRIQALRRPLHSPSLPRSTSRMTRNRASCRGWATSSAVYSERNSWTRNSVSRADSALRIFFEDFYSSRARSIARITACALLRDSLCSSSGTESATMPAPACTYPLPPCVSSERMAMHESRLPEKSA